MTGSVRRKLLQYAGSSVLVTGGLGFLGSALVNALCQVSCRIVLLLRHDRDADQPKHSQAEIVTIHGNIQEHETWQRALAGADYVFHFAAQTSVYKANQDPRADLDANAVPVLQMLETCRGQGWKPRIVFAGTVTQGGIPRRLPADETAPDQPMTVYDIHKLLAEKYLQFYAWEEAIPTVTLRLANVYGPGSQVSSGDRGVLNRMIRNGLEGKPLTVYGDGARVRDYVFIDDVVCAFVAAGAAAPNLAGNYYIVGGGTGFRIVDAVNLVADRVMARLGQRPNVVHVAPPKGMSAIEERDFIANTERFRAATGWEPRVSLAEGIDRTLDYLLSRQGVDPRVPQ